MTDSSASARNHTWKLFIPVIIIAAIAVGGLFFLKSQLGPSPNDSQSGGHREIKEGNVLDDFTLSRFHGGDIAYSQLKHKVGMINFWATWCEACMAEMPSIVKLREEFHKDGFEVVSINVDDNPEAVLPASLSRFKMDFPIYIDAGQKMSMIFDVHAIPLTVLLNKDRKILMVESGDRNWNNEEMHQKMKNWLR